MLLNSEFMLLMSPRKTVIRAMTYGTNGLAAEVQCILDHYLLALEINNLVQKPPKIRKTLRKTKHPHKHPKINDETVEKIRGKR